MQIVPININRKASIRDKARLNVCIAKDLAESFGGSKADYLKRLNQKLKMRIIDNASCCAHPLSIAA